MIEEQSIQDQPGRLRLLQLAGLALLLLASIGSIIAGIISVAL
ncbi:MAG TPA: hypothetical protein VD907_03805 [Verrucomicrobiae bacterium]|nr:hypothetical protein [Verrucomicrobiae bacterium]